MGTNWIDLSHSSQYVLTSFPPPQHSNKKLGTGYGQHGWSTWQSVSSVQFDSPLLNFYLRNAYRPSHWRIYVIYIGNISYTVANLAPNWVHHYHFHFICSHCRLVWRLWIITQPITYQPQRLVSTLDWQEIKYASMDFMLIVLVWKSLLQ